jgi:hypothetical protein
MRRRSEVRVVRRGACFFCSNKHKWKASLACLHLKALNPPLHELSPLQKLVRGGKLIGSCYHSKRDLLQRVIPDDCLSADLVSLCGVRAVALSVHLILFL